MNKSTLLGIVLGIGLVAGAIYLETDDWRIFYNLAGILIVVGGTAAASFLSYPFSDVMGVFRSFYVVLRKEPPRVEDYSQQIMNLVIKARKGGRLALEKEVGGIKNLFLADGIQMLADGYSMREIDEILKERVYFRAERERKEADILTTMSKYSPAFGMIGTLIGLIILLSNMTIESMDNIGSGMSVALITTFYGVILANLIFKPIAVKLYTRTEEEVLLMEMIIDSIKMISEGWHPAKVQDYMNSFIKPAKRIVPNRSDIKLRKIAPAPEAEVV
ncbi:MAG: MotA/TolQ/ExbB proton channel family protein [Candidatus Marinimicrobia bacterium]|nr:MotA/TolQ/ExbB proton channel family protein [Candidatus Neomarinimicrobiota bacterium]